MTHSEDRFAFQIYAWNLSGSWVIYYFISLKKNFPSISPQMQDLVFGVFFFDQHSGYPFVVTEIV